VFPRLRDATTAPVVGDIVSVPSAFDTEVMAPCPTQTPFIAKQPADRLNPTFDVEVADPFTVNPLTVVVPNPVPETVSADDEAEVTASKMFPELLPHTDNLLYGLVVPTANLPLVSMRTYSL
jgi:hypothetical protein